MLPKDDIIVARAICTGIYRNRDNQNAVNSIAYVMATLYGSISNAHTQKVLVHTQKVLVHTQKVLVHTQKVLVHAQKVLVHAQKVLVHTQKVFRPTYRQF